MTALPMRVYTEISTGHVTKNDMELISTSMIGGSSDYSLIAYSYDEGAFVIIPDDGDWPGQRALLSEYGHSEEFLHIVDLCRELHIQILRLDADAGRVAHLPVFDW